MQCFQLAAEQGNADAIYNIGYNFYCGEGVKQDYDTAVECFRVAAEMGQPNAMFMIGECYYKGKGSEKDPDQAAERYNLKLDFSAA